MILHARKLGYFFKLRKLKLYIKLHNARDKSIMYSKLDNFFNVTNKIITINKIDFN